MSALPAGTVLAGRYEIQRLLGTGSMKMVYLCRDTQAGRAVALALLRTEVARTDPTLAARFSREGRAAAALQSPYIVQVYDVGKLDDGTRFLVTEAILGRGLDELLSRARPAPEDAVRWTLQVLWALTEAHARGVLHRDVKPENVLLADEPHAPGGAIARLTDFGLAKVLDGALEGSFALRTAQNVVLGTPDYMPPEQWQGQVADGRADLYAAGVMLYEMLVGHAPFESRMLHAMMTLHLTQPPPAFPRNLAPLALALEPVVMRALAKHPFDRWRDAVAMRDAVTEATGITVTAPPARARPTLSLAGRPLRAELLYDGWPAAVTVFTGRVLTLGRDNEADLLVRFLPETPDNQLRARTISRQHARLEWTDAQPLLSDLGSRTGTRVDDRAVGSTPVPLRHGSMVQIGRHARFRFDLAPASAGEPGWARLVRIDDAGRGQVLLLLRRDVELSGSPEAGLPLHEAAGTERLWLAVSGDRLVARGQGMDDHPLADGEALRVGGAVLSVALS